MGCSVAVLAAGTYLVVDAMPSQAATSGLRTATVETGSVTQTISLSGSVERVDQVTATFRTAGTVTSVKVSVGDEVEAGDVLATLDTDDLERAVTVAQANLVSAQASLDAASSSTSAASAILGGAVHRLGVHAGAIGHPRAVGGRTEGRHLRCAPRGRRLRRPGQGGRHRLPAADGWRHAPRPRPDADTHADPLPQRHHDCDP